MTRAPSGGNSGDIEFEWIEKAEIRKAKLLAVGKTYN